MAEATERDPNENTEQAPNELRLVLRPDGGDTVGLSFLFTDIQEVFTLIMRLTQIAAYISGPGDDSGVVDPESEDASA